MLIMNGQFIPIYIEERDEDIFDRAASAGPSAVVM
jgi:hypothetical protein